MEYTEGVRFDSLGLSPEIMRAIAQREIQVSTPVQAGCIPPMMDWQDVIAKAPTGTGKTFAYGIPIVEHIDPEDESVQAVILAPTRELAIQITDEIRDLSRYKPGVRCVCLYGGQPIGRQIDTLKKRPQIVVATPGRLSDHMKRRTVRVDTAQTVVLDEADRMLDMGFIHDVTRLLDRMDKRKNLGLFSATISREVMDIAWVYQRDAAEITVREDEKNKPDIKQFRMDVSYDGKADAIERILNETGFDRCMAFSNTKGSTERITKFLQLRGIDAERIGERLREARLEVRDGLLESARHRDGHEVDVVHQHLAVLREEMLPAQGLQTVERDEDVALPLRNDWRVDLRAEPHARDHAAAALGHAVDLALFHVHAGDRRRAREHVRREQDALPADADEGNVDGLHGKLLYSARATVSSGSSSWSRDSMPCLSVMSA